MIQSFAIFTFASGDDEKITKGINEHMDLMRNQPGLIKSSVGKALDNPAKYLVYGEWKTKEEYESFGEKMRNAKDVQEDFTEFFDLMIEEPIFGSFEVRS